MLRASLAALSLLAAVPAGAQEMGGIHTRNTAAELSAIQANSNSGCPLSSTSVTVGVNKAAGMQSSAQQQLATMGGASGCRPLVNTQVVAGVNLALGGSSAANQAIAAQGPRGVLATTTYTRGYNLGYGAGSTANQRLINQTGR